MNLIKNEAHIWSTSLSMVMEDPSIIDHLSQDEQLRAKRLKIDQIRRRFIASHSWLRKILSFYTDTSPNTLQFTYARHNKPALSPNPSQVQFNLSHSADMAVCAVAKGQAVGIDIEYQKAQSNLALAKRFFSIDEYNLLNQSPENLQISQFYELWTKKEALLKATGKGLFIPLNQFSVTIDQNLTQIMLDNQLCSLIPIFIHKQYASALAIEGTITKISYFQLKNHLPTLMNEQILSLA